MPAFQFLHASDFHLERPPEGLAEIADHLREPLIEAPFRAAEKVFDAAIGHAADFVVLAGDLVAPRRCGPRGILFLREQFARLAEREIEVYWAGGNVDRPSDWPAQIGWPSNVHIFPSHEPALYPVARRGKHLCDIVGQSLSERSIDSGGYERVISNRPSGEFLIGVAYLDLDTTHLSSDQVQYWALGGLHEPTLPDQARPVIHYPGSPQGRCRGELGPHGCTLVHVAENGDMSTTPLITDVVRYCHEEVRFGAWTSATAASEIEEALRTRLQALAGANPGVTLLVRFTLVGDQALSAAQRSRLPLSAIMGVLRGEFGYRSPPVWLDQVQLPLPKPPAEGWTAQETLLGDFLRAARRQERPDALLDLDPYLPAGVRASEVREVLGIDNPEIVRRSIAEAMSLGAGLLCPEEARA